MTKLKKWNPDKHIYEDFESPAQQPCLYCDDMDLFVQCANCGTLLLFGSTYTSRQIHNEMGFGYSVCENCYRFECLKK